jgi:hypothetical protein
LLEQMVNLTVQEAYEKIRFALADEKGRFVLEKSPKQIVVKQGSLWGISPKTAKKTIEIDLEPSDNGTKVKCISKLSSDWKNITLIGCVLAAILIGVCIWMIIDLTAFMSTNVPSVWSWLVTEGGNVNALAGKAFINLAWELAVFLTIVIVLEAVIVVYVRSKIDLFASKILETLR